MGLESFQTYHFDTHIDQSLYLLRPDEQIAELAFNGQKQSVTLNMPFGSADYQLHELIHLGEGNWIDGVSMLILCAVKGGYMAPNGRRPYQDALSSILN